MNNFPLLQCENLVKTFHDGTSTIEVLSGVNFTLSQGARVAIVGPSGSGKSTLLHVLSGLDTATSGDVLVDNQSWLHLSERQRCNIRNQKLGFIYQFHHLLPEFTAVENVAMPLLLRAIKVADAMEQAAIMLTKVGLNLRLHHKPAQLSGGERQRVAIARALVHNPRCVIADEPTGDLDQVTARVSFELMLELNQATNTALLIVTHDQALASSMDIVYTLTHGQLCRN